MKSAFKVKSVVSLILATIMVFSVSALSFGAKGTMIDYKAAIKTANKRLIDGRLLELDIESEKGKTYYDMTWLGKDDYQYDIEVDAYTQEVLKVKRDGYEWNATNYRVTQESLAEVVATASKNLDDPSLYKIDLDFEKDALTYKISHKDSDGLIYKAYINAKTGAVISSTNNYLTATQEKPATIKNIDKATAEAIAIKYAGGGTVTKSKTDYDDGKLIYEIDVRTSQLLTYEFEIDAETGNILDVDIDD